MLTALILAAMRPVEEVHLRFGHRQDAGQLDAAEAQLIGDGMQNGALIGLDLAIGKGCLQLHLQAEAQYVPLPQTGTTELGQSFPQRDLRLLAQTDRLLSPCSLISLQSHPIHQVGGNPDLLHCNLAIRLGDMTHDGESGMEKDRLLLLAGATLKRAPNTHAPIETMADPETKHGTKHVAEQKTEEGAQHLTPNTHGSRPRDVNECAAAADHPARAAALWCQSRATRRPAWRHRPGLAPSIRA